MRCAAYCVASSFNSDDLYKYLKNSHTVTSFDDALHISLKDKEGDIFFFPYGTIVFWGLDEKDEIKFQKKIGSFKIEPVEERELELFHYGYGEHATVEGDEITLPTEDVFSKLAFSHGMAQSTKLASFEQAIKKTILITKELPIMLAKKGSTSLSRKDIRKMMGRLFVARSSINLHLELLDTPEFFWEHAELENYYELITHHLDRNNRVNILNKRLLIFQELFDMLSTDLNHKHSSRLEWTIIWLIVIEVLIHLVTDLWNFI